MTVLNSIWNRARPDLVIVTEACEEDVYLWEHSVRVANTARIIARLPSVQARSPDENAMVAAALYQNAGWAAAFRDQEIERSAMLLRPTTAAFREQGILMMERSLAGLVPPRVIERAATAIRSRNDRIADSIEGQVVTEAENLNEFGMVAFWPNIRRGSIEGKGVRAAIDTWHRRKEYQYWTALLNDSFRIAEVQATARKRLERYEQAMAALEEQDDGTDLVSALGVGGAVPLPEALR